MYAGTGLGAQRLLTAAFRVFDTWAGVLCTISFSTGTVYEILLLGILSTMQNRQRSLSTARYSEGRSQSIEFSL